MLNKNLSNALNIIQAVCYIPAVQYNSCPYRTFGLKKKERDNTLPACLHAFSVPKTIKHPIGEGFGCFSLIPPSLEIFLGLLLSLCALIHSEGHRLHCFNVRFPFLALVGADFEDRFSLLLLIHPYQTYFYCRCSALMGSNLGKNASPLVRSLISHDTLLSAFLKCDMGN